MSKRITIAGAGPVGCLAAVYLARKGHEITLYERRPDMRKATVSAGRSINLALSDRGLRGLEGAGIAQDILKVAIPMYGRMMHSVEGNQIFQPYGLQGQAINSVSRGGINQALLDCAESFSNVKIIFNQRCVDADPETATAWFEDIQTHERIQVQADTLIGTDGAYSAIRDRMQKTDRYNYQQHYIEHGYKELTIPAGAAGEFLMEKNALHIWPRKQYMMIALPNMDGSFTCTLFFPFEGNPSFASLQTDQDIEYFFRTQFGDAVPMMPTLLQDFHKNPTSSLVTVRSFPWAYKDKILMIGDAAHAIVPFFGQGMNAGFEDCRILNEFLEQYSEDNWADMFADYQRVRKPNADAIADLALANFIEMRDLVADPDFLERKKAERILHELFPEQFIPLYSMVTFSHIPYAEAIRQGQRNDKIITNMLQIPDVLNNWQDPVIQSRLSALFTQH
jgi:kynurenine 3-monooxygenase